MSSNSQMFCHHCHKPFTGDVRAKYCSGTCKSKAYRERKEKMIDLLVSIVHGFGFITFNRNHADLVIEAYHNNVKALIEGFGFKYDNFTHVWVKV